MFKRCMYRHIRSQNWTLTKNNLKKVEEHQDCLRGKGPAFYTYTSCCYVTVYVGKRNLYKAKIPMSISRLRKAASFRKIKGN